MLDYPYWLRQTKQKPLYPDLAWNIPEQKQGTITIIGGHSGSFATPIKISEYLSKTYPLREVNLILPDSLRKNLPLLPNLIFTPSSPAGSFAPSSQLTEAIQNSKVNLFIGDFSKNSAAELAITKALTDQPEQKPNKTPNNIDQSDRTKTEQNPIFILARDTIDLITAAAEPIIQLKNLTLLASAAQLQKLLRALYYPKMLLLSSPLPPIIETLHKFTLTYPNLTLLTFHSDQIITARSGQIITTPLADTDLTPINLWDGRLAARTAALQLYSADPLGSVTAAVF